MTSIYNKNNKHSDKLGELLKWYQNFDKLDHEQVLKHTYFTLKLLTTSQLKSVLFSGLRKYAEDIEYELIFRMQKNLSSYDIYDEKKENDDNNDSEIDMNVNEMNEKKEIVLENKISWLDMVPTDIILNNVCSCLWMRDIFDFSKCARRYAIICQSPPAMNNLQLRIGGNSICSVKNYFHIHRRDHHRLRGVKNLSITGYICNNIPHYLKLFFRQMKHVQHLSCNSLLSIGEFAKPYFADLKSISFINTHVSRDEFLWVLSIDENIVTKVESEGIFISDTIYNLETIAFDDCRLDDNSMPYLCEMLFPSKSNKLSVLKLKSLNVYYSPHNKWKEYLENQLKDENRVCKSLCNLKAFVTSNERQSLGYNLSCAILSVLQFQLECIHIHSRGYSIKEFPFPFLMQDTKYYESGKQEGILHLKELCISFSAGNKYVILKKICTNLLEDVFLTHVPKKNTGGLQKLCLTFPSFIVANKFVNKSLKTMLQRSTSLKFLQIRILSLSSEKSLSRFLKYLCNAFSASTSSAYHQQQQIKAFVFKLKFEEGLRCPDFVAHVRKMIDIFFLAFPNGMFHWKCKNNTMESDFFEDKARFYSVNGNAFSVVHLNAVGNCVAYDTAWMCDCNKCLANASETDEIARKGEWEFI